MKRSDSFIKETGQMLLTAVVFLLLLLALFSTAGAETLTKISAGRYHACGLKADGTVVCWGGNTYGQATQ